MDRSDKCGRWLALWSAVLLVLSGCVGGVWMPFDDATVVTTIAHTGNPAPDVNSIPRVAPGGEVAFFISPATHLRSQVPNWETPKAGTRTIVWVPPKGVTGVSYSMPPESTTPPYIFRDVPANAFLTLRHTMPGGVTQIRNTFLVAYQPSPGAPTEVGGVTRLTTADVTRQATAGVTRQVTAGVSGRSAAVLPLSPDGAVLDDAAARQASALNAGLRMTHTLSPVGAQLDTSLCEDLRSALVEGRLVAALRVPLQFDAGDDTNVPLPLLLGDGNGDVQTVSLNRDAAPDTPVITATLSYAPAHFNALAAQMPAADDEHWLALHGLSASAACPTGLDVPAGAWDLEVTLSLDADNLVIDFERRGALTAFCWVGRDAPFDTAGGQLLRFVADSGEPVTCLRPVPVSLDTDPEAGLVLGDVQADYTQATRRLRLSEILHNETATSVPVNVSYTADLVADWELWVSGAGSANPTTQVPAGQPVSVGPGDGGAVRLWFLTTVPEATTAGPYGLSLTATGTQNSQLAAEDVIPFWIGEWVPHEVAETGGTAYLPLVLR